MTTKNIVIGCDTTSSLVTIINCLQGISGIEIATATRTSDLIGLIKSSNPVLIIIQFRNNQLVLNTITSYMLSPRSAILCLTNSYENENLIWGEQWAVFSMVSSLQQQGGHLAKRVRSILLLSKNAEQPNHAKGHRGLPMGRDTDLKNLSRFALELDQKRATLEKIKVCIKDICSEVEDPIRRKLVGIVNAIKTSTTDKSHWEDFKIYFEHINPKFLEHLTHEHPTLTPKDLKYCCYVKMNMSNNDITTLLGINQESVRTHKYRLKKKLSLSKEESLRSYINTITHTKHLRSAAKA